MLAGVAKTLMADLAEIDRIGQQGVKGAAGEGIAAGARAVSVDPDLNQTRSVLVTRIGKNCDFDRWDVCAQRCGAIDFADGQSESYQRC
jgi:hypothetical protein